MIQQSWEKKFNVQVELTTNADARKKYATIRYVFNCVKSIHKRPESKKKKKGKKHTQWPFDKGVFNISIYASNFSCE